MDQGRNTIVYKPRTIIDGRCDVRTYVQGRIKQENQRDTCKRGTHRASQWAGRKSIFDHKAKSFPIMKSIMNT